MNQILRLKEAHVDLSVIIVSYNVKFYTEQCIFSVLQASRQLNVEILVVDNVSTDGSVEYIRSKYPDVEVIANSENVGFGRANNQALQKAKGEYILFLNPDTVVPEDCFDKCLSYLRQNDMCAALGPHLIDGTGEFLPESKRGFPDLWVSFCKVVGLGKIFPHSARFNGYYLGNLPEHETNPVDILVGCFMMMSKKWLDEHGGFDPQFFMYGEDIDLSYRVTQSGYLNIYYPEVSVIHYKGESTQKGTSDYVKMFYEAMLIFSRKHFTTSQTNLYSIFIRLAIIIKGALSFLVSLIRRVRMFLIDFLVAMFSLYIMQVLWNKYVKVDIIYDQRLNTIAFLAYSMIWVVILYFNGVYDKPYKRYRIWRGILLASMVILAVYSLLPLDLRFSRGITLFGTFLSGILMLLYRRLFTWLKIPGFDFRENEQKGLLVVGHHNDTSYIEDTFNTEQMKLDIKGTVSPEQEANGNFIGSISDLERIASKLNIHEIVFTYSPLLSFQSIIEWFQKLKGQYEFKIFREKSQTIIGSNSRNTAGDLYSLDPVYLIAASASRRNKRVLDLLTSSLFILLFPLMLFSRQRNKVVKNLLAVWVGRKTWVGYAPDDTLPEIKNSVFDISSGLMDSPNLAMRIKNDYALKYKASDDFSYLWNALFS